MSTLRIFYKYFLFYFSCILIYLAQISPLQGQQFKSYNSVGLLQKTTDLKSDKIKLQNLYTKSIKENDSVKMAQCLIGLSAADRSTLNYNTAFKNSGEALFIAEELNNPLLMAQAHEEFGVLNYLFKQDEQAGFNFKKAHYYYQQLYKQKQVTNLDIYQSYYNLALYYQRTENGSMLSKYIDSCKIVDTKATFNKNHRIYLNEKKASLAEWNNKPDEALELLKESASIIENLSGDTQTIHKPFLIIVYARMANIYVKAKNLELAKSFFKKSLEIKDVHGEVTFYIAYVYLRYAMLLESLEDYENAYKNSLKSTNITDTYLNPRNENTQGFLTVRNRYDEQLQQKNKELAVKNLELAKKNQEILRFRIFFFVALFLVVIIGLIIRGRIKAASYDKKQQSSKDLLEHKNKELTVNMLHLIEKEEVIQILKKQLSTTNTDRATQTLLKSLEKQSVNLWDAFNQRFIAQNNDFYDRLQSAVPDLSSADLKICALIKLNFSGKEMAYLLGISLGSVHVARHRLRKKMNLERDENLTKFINSI